MTGVAMANLGIKFLVELAAVVAYGLGAFRLVRPGIARYVAMVAVPLMVVLIWGIWIAPQADARLKMPWRLLAELLIFLGAAVLLWFARLRIPAAVFAAVAIVCDLLSVALEPFEL